MALMALAVADPNHPRLGFFIASLVLCLPTMLPTLPVFYVALATVWGLTGADDGGATWPVTAAYITAIGLVAVGNASMFKLVIRRHRQQHNRLVRVDFGT
jgi:hypothetical protein